MKKRALVLQGGGLRGAYTAGVLDVFIEHGITFDCIIGVSAGSLNTFSYVTKQKGRAKRLLEDSLTNHRLASISNLVKFGSFFNFDYMFFDYLKDEWPFDIESFKHCKEEVIFVATDVDSGKARYFSNKHGDDMFLASMASSSIAVVSKKVKIEGHYYLDGGYSDGIPFKKAIDEGYDKIVVISTRDRDFHNDEEKYIKSKTTRLACLRYRKSLNFVECIKNYAKQYNINLANLYEYERENKLFLIAPSLPLRKAKSVNANEDDISNLSSNYNLGRCDALSLLSKMDEYLKEEEK